MRGESERTRERERKREREREIAKERAREKGRKREGERERESKIERDEWGGGRQVTLGWERKNVGGSAKHPTARHKHSAEAITSSSSL